MTSWKLELLRTLTNVGKIGLSHALAPSGVSGRAKRRVRKGGCTPCEAMAQVDAARQRAKAARAGDL